MSSFLHGQHHSIVNVGIWATVYHNICFRVDIMIIFMFIFWFRISFTLTLTHISFALFISSSGVCIAYIALGYSCTLSTLNHHLLTLKTLHTFMTHFCLIFWYVIRQRVKIHFFSFTFSLADSLFLFRVILVIHI